MPYRIETTHATASSLGPSLTMEDEKQARAVAEGLREEGLDVALFEREPTGTWKRILLGELDADGQEVRRDNLLDEFVVIIKSGEGDDYELASQTIFLTRDLAEVYARGAYPDQAPLVVRGRFSKLRID